MHERKLNDLVDKKWATKLQEVPANRVHQDHPDFALRGNHFDAPNRALRDFPLLDRSTRALVRCYAATAAFSRLRSAQAGGRDR